MENELDSENLAIDPNDKERQKQFAEIRKKSLANFDANTARQRKLEENQSNDRIMAIREQAQEAQLRAAGKTMRPKHRRSTSRPSSVSARFMSKPTPRGMRRRRRSS
jgi:hypothetical protein